MIWLAQTPASLAVEIEHDTFATYAEIFMTLLFSSNSTIFLIGLMFLSGQKNRWLFLPIGIWILTERTSGGQVPTLCGLQLARFLRMVSLLTPERRYTSPFVGVYIRLAFPDAGETCCPWYRLPVRWFHLCCWTDIPVGLSGSVFLGHWWDFRNTTGAYSRMNSFVRVVRILMPLPDWIK